MEKLLRDSIPYFAHLDSVGDGSGEVDAVGDYRGTPIRWRLENTNPDHSLVVGALVLYVQGPGKFLPDNYAGITELDPGIRIAVLKGSVGLIDLTNGEPIIHTCCLNRLFSSVDYNLNGKMPGDNWISATWSFDRHGSPLVLQPGESLEVILNDDFRGLTAQRFMAYGYWADSIVFR